VALLVFPLHRRTLSWLQRNGTFAGLIVAIGVVVVGLLSAIRVGSDSSWGVGALVLVGAVLVAAGVLMLAGRLSRFDERSGLLAILPDRIELVDRALGEDGVVIRREDILDVVPPAVRDQEPYAALRSTASIGATIDIGRERPNLEILLRTPLVLPIPTAGSRHSVGTLRMQTPGAAAVLAWNRNEVLEVPGRKWYESLAMRDVHLRRWSPGHVPDKGSPF